MSDLINREDAINAIYHHFPNVSMERATEILHECETAESVIRCKDCKYYEWHDTKLIKWCYYAWGVYGYEVYPKKGFYCSHAERKEE